LVGIAQPEKRLRVDLRKKGFGSSPQDGRGDGALADGKKGWGVVGRNDGAEVSSAELPVDLGQTEADAIAVGQRLGRVEANLR